jgi:DNA-binding SARP family transcriptional activator
MLQMLLLGPVEALVSGLAITLSPLQRNLLTVLALSDGSVVSTERIIDALWGGDHPAAPRSRVQGLISELRRKVGAALVTRHPGYLLDAQVCHTDVRHLNDLVRRARQAATPDRAADHLGEALALWRGDPLAGVCAPGVEVDRARLGELRVGLLEDRFEAELELGRPAEVVAELTAAVSAYPLRERLAGQLMLALYRCNRQADALRVFQALRDQLAEEVGSDPCADLRRIHAMILRGEPGRPAAPAAGADPRPAQLPAGVGHFTGRTGELAALGRGATGRGDDPRVLLVTGLGGLGKTALVVQWARAVARDFTDGQIFLDLHGRDPDRTVSPRTALGTVLASLGVARADLPDSLDARKAVYRTLVSGRRVLLVADDAVSTEQLLPLVPPTGASQLVVTSRFRLAALSAHHEVHTVRLEPFDLDTTGELLARIVGADRLADPAAARVVRWCGGYPLLVRLIGMKLATRPGQSLASFADELADTADALLLGDQRSVHAALVSAHRSLSPAAAHLFGRFGLDPASARCIHPTATVTDPHGVRVRRLFDELVAANLVTEAGPDCYRFPDLVHRFARRCGAELVEQDLVDAWLRRQPAVLTCGRSAPDPQ